MAKEQWSMGGSLVPEEKIAKRLLTRHGLTIPFPIDDLIKKYAELIYLPIPIEGVDGLSLNIKVPGKKPKVIINSDAALVRQRFTLAHELGHLVIPWHCGIELEEMEDGYYLKSYRYDIYEQEANRFAAELLMPTELINNLYSTEKNLSRLHKKLVLKADVSEQAVAIKMATILSKNIIYCAEKNGKILYSGKSIGTSTKANFEDNFNPLRVFPHAIDYSSIDYGKATIHWWQLPSAVELPVTKDNRTWREILDEIVSESFPHEDNQRRKMSVNGVIASVNGNLKKNGAINTEALYAECLNRMRNYAGLEWLVKHKNFTAFLAKKVNDLTKNDNSK